MTAPLIRTAGPEDVPALLALVPYVHELHLARYPDRFVPLDPAAVGPSFAQRLADPTWRGWIAEEGGAPAGYVLAQLREQGASPFTAPRRAVHVDQIVVHPDARRRGIGRALLDAVMAWADELGIDAITLDTWAFNEGARAAFERAGFALERCHYRRTR